MLGVAKIKARYSDKQLSLPIDVVSDGGPNLMGRDWLEVNLADLANVHSLEHETPLKGLLDTYSELFTEELGCLKGATVKLFVHDNAQPRFFNKKKG